MVSTHRNSGQSVDIVLLLFLVIRLAYFCWIFDTVEISEADFLRVGGCVLFAVLAAFSVTPVPVEYFLLQQTTAE